jgi:signal transduction histidine kinase
MKNLLPDTIATRAMLLLVVGLAFTHLISNIFYSTDRKSELLTTGGEHAVQWVATIGSFTETISVDDWETIVASANVGDRAVTLTENPVVKKTSPTDWREIALQQELGTHIPAERLSRVRIAYSGGGDHAKMLAEWRDVFVRNGQVTPEELILISMQIDDGRWLNVATGIASPPSFFSARLGLSMAVMLIAVVAISALIVGRMTEPLKQLSRAAEKLGTDVQGPAIPETGPEEVRRTAHAFNTMQNRIRRFVEDRTQMLGAITHDLGTPITRLRLRAEFVRDQDLREKMLRDLDDMQHMVASTLAFIREDAALEPQTTADLGSLLARVCDDIKDAGAEVELAETPRWVLVDCRPIALRRALGNLIENAVKYGRSARVSLLPEPDRLLIQIDDDGPGIPEDRQEDVFQPFLRLEDSRNRETGGTGLGLAVARTIVRAHGGDIHLSNRKGGGLRVTVSLPLSHQPQEAPAGDTARADLTGTRDVLDSQSNKSATGRAGLYAVAGTGSYPPATGQIFSTPQGIQPHLKRGRVKSWKMH